MNWFKLCLQKYATFEGRASRAEFWYFALFSFLITLAVSIVGGVIGSIVNMPSLYALGFLVTVALIVPSLAVTVRRLHDTDRSGWMYFISLVPVVGPIALLVFYCQEGSRGDNRFGADTKLAA